MALAKVKPNHNGAKNGGGAYCKRAEAKAASKRRRRANGKKAVRAALRDYAKNGK